MAVGLAAGRLDRFLLSLAGAAAVAVAVAVAVAMRTALRARPAGRWAARKPRLTVVLIGVLAIGIALALEALGLTCRAGRGDHGR